VVEDYAPKRGDVVWITLYPQAGHEQAERRRAVVLSPAAYNVKVWLATFCSITSSVKGHPLEVIIPDGVAVAGVIPADQVKSLDWRARDAALMSHLPPETLRDVLRELNLLLRD